jgi:hypothetical protein
VTQYCCNPIHGKEKGRREEAYEQSWMQKDIWANREVNIFLPVTYTRGFVTNASVLTTFSPVLGVAVAGDVFLRRGLIAFQASSCVIACLLGEGGGKREM